MGIDENYRFVANAGDVKDIHGDDLPSLCIMDISNYGLDVPKEFVAFPWEYSRESVEGASKLTFGKLFRSYTVAPNLLCVEVFDASLLKWEKAKEHTNLYYSVKLGYTIKISKSKHNLLMRAYVQYTMVQHAEQAMRRYLTKEYDAFEIEDMVNNMELTVLEKHQTFLSAYQNAVRVVYDNGVTEYLQWQDNELVPVK